MPLSYFFVADLAKEVLVLDEDTSKHITQVLRMKVGDGLLLTDGRGTKAEAVIEDDHRKHCSVRLLARQAENQPEPRIAVAISLIKNASRFEWFLEKATEIGISEIIPLLCERTEKEKFRHDRLHNILISALLQSQQSWLPVLHPPTNFREVLKLEPFSRKFIAHCLPEQKQPLSAVLQQQSSLILIGPEGDFSPGEIELALQHGFQAVALGHTRLRTETAGMVAATLLRMGL